MRKSNLVVDSNNSKYQEQTTEEVAKYVEPRRSRIEKFWMLTNILGHILFHKRVPANFTHMTTCMTFKSIRQPQES